MASPQEAAQNEQGFRGPPLHLLVFAYQNRLTGTVTIDTEAGQRHQVYFHEGAPAKVLLADPVLTLDSIIVRMGAVPPEDLVETARMAYDQGKLLGRSLVSRGLITEDTLAAALRWQIQEKVAHLMSVSERTHYRIASGQNHLESYGGVDLTAIDPLVMIMVAARLPPSSAVLDRTAAELRGLLLGVTEDPALARLAPTPEEQHVLDMLRSAPHSVDSLIDAGADERAVKSVLFTLSTAQLIEEIEEIIEDFPDDDDDAIEVEDDAIEVQSSDPADHAHLPPEPVAHTPYGDGHAPYAQDPYAHSGESPEAYGQQGGYGVDNHNAHYQDAGAHYAHSDDAHYEHSDDNADAHYEHSDDDDDAHYEHSDDNADAHSDDHDAQVDDDAHYGQDVAQEEDEFEDYAHDPRIHGERPRQAPAAPEPQHHDGYANEQAAYPHHEAAVDPGWGNSAEQPDPYQAAPAHNPIHGYHSAAPSGGSGRPDPFWDEPLYDEPPISSRAADSSRPSLEPAYGQPLPARPSYHEPPASNRLRAAPQAQTPQPSDDDVDQPTQHTMEAMTSQRSSSGTYRPEVRRSRRSADDSSEDMGIPSSRPYDTPSEQGWNNSESAPGSVPSPSSQQPHAVARVKVQRQMQRRGPDPHSDQPATTKQSFAGNIMRKIRGDEEPEEEAQGPVIPVDKPDWCMADFDGMSGVDAFAIAEESLKILNYAKADAAAAKAVSEDPNNGTYRATHAWIQAKRLGTPITGQEDTWYDDPIAVLTDVLIREPNFELAYYYRARVFKTAKKMKKAIEDFEMCTMLNPGNVDAQRELKEYKILRAKQRRRRAMEGPEEPQKKGFLDWVSDKVKR